MRRLAMLLFCLAGCDAEPLAGQGGEVYGCSYPSPVALEEVNREWELVHCERHHYTTQGQACEDCWVTLERGEDGKCPIEGCVFPLVGPCDLYRGCDDEMD